MKGEGRQRENHNCLDVAIFLAFVSPGHPAKKRAACNVTSNIEVCQEGSAKRFQGSRLGKPKQRGVGQNEARCLGEEAQKVPACTSMFPQLYAMVHLLKSGKEEKKKKRHQALFQSQGEQAKTKRQWNQNPTTIFGSQTHVLSNLQSLILQHWCEVEYIGLRGGGAGGQRGSEDFHRGCCFRALFGAQPTG